MGPRNVVDETRSRWSVQIGVYSLSSWLNTCLWYKMSVSLCLKGGLDTPDALGVIGKTRTLHLSGCPIHDHMLHRTWLLTEAQVRGSKATVALLPRTCASVNNPVLWSIWSWPHSTFATCTCGCGHKLPQHHGMAKGWITGSGSIYFQLSNVNCTMGIWRELQHHSDIAECRKWDRVPEGGEEEEKVATPYCAMLCVGVHAWTCRLWFEHVWTEVECMYFVLHPLVMEQAIPHVASVFKWNAWTPGKKCLKGQQGQLFLTNKQRVSQGLLQRTDVPL